MLQKNHVVSYDEIKINAAAQKLLMQAPPTVNMSQVQYIAEQHYETVTHVESLSGERDRNFLLKSPKNGAWVLKIINPIETEAETDMQIQVLDWLAQRQCAVQTPQAVRTQQGDNVVTHTHAEGTWQIRAYTFLEGTPVNQVPMTHALQYALGGTAARMTQALAGFEHAALERVLLWDVMHLSQLQAWAQEVMQQDELGGFVLAFFKHFQQQIWPALNALPSQVIHADLSQSNIVVSENHHHQIDGVLDFGDLTAAPRIVELGIVASYALDVGNLAIDESLQHIVAGFESVQELNEAEKKSLMDVIIARLIQRIVISQWRAQRFPDNATYILRATAQARQTLEALMPDYVQAHPASFKSLESAS